MKTSIALAAATLSTLVFTATRARADEPTPSSAFRARGAVLISSTGGGSIASALAGGGLPWVAGTPFLSISRDDNDGANAIASTAVVVNPAFDVFVIDGLSIGGEVAFAYVSSSVSDDNLTVAAIAPRIGWDFPLGSAFSIWPRVGASFAYESQASSTTAIVSASLDAQILWHATRSFFVGVGPGITHDFFAPATSTDASTGISTSGEAAHQTRVRYLAFTIGGVL